MSSIIRGLGDFFHRTPNDPLQREAEKLQKRHSAKTPPISYGDLPPRSKVEMPDDTYFTPAPTPTMTQKVVPVVMGGIATVSTATAVVNAVEGGLNLVSKVSSGASTVASNVAGSVANATQSAANTTVNAIGGIGKSMLDTASNIQDIVSEKACSIVGWKTCYVVKGLTWGFRCLPLPIQFGIGLMGIYGAYLFWQRIRGRGGYCVTTTNNQHMHVNFQLTPPPGSKNCRLQTVERTNKDGHKVTDVHVDCSEQKGAEAVKKPIRELTEAEKIQAHERLVRSAGEVSFQAENLHEVMLEYSKTDGILSNLRMRQVKALVNRFDELKPSFYLDERVFKAVKEAGLLKHSIDLELASKAQKKAAELKKRNISTVDKICANPQVLHQRLQKYGEKQLAHLTAATKSTLHSILAEFDAQKSSGYKAAGLKELAERANSLKAQIDLELFAHNQSLARELKELHQALKAHFEKNMNKLSSWTTARLTEILADCSRCKIRHYEVQTRRLEPILKQAQLVKSQIEQELSGEEVPSLSMDMLLP